MKVDKDALIKHRFWILLGVFALLWIICLSFVVANAGGPIEEAKKNYDAAQGAVSKLTRPKNESFLPPWQKYGATFTRHKNEVWKIAWNGDPVKPGQVLPNGQQPWTGQGGMYDWPSDQEHPLNNILLYPDSPFEPPLREWYKTQAAYGKEFNDVHQELQPDGTAIKGKPPSGPLGAVTFRGGYENVMQPIAFDTITRTPDAEECWLAQEDFWVKRELLYVVRDAMALAARLEPVPDASDKKDAPAKDAKDAKYLGRQVFRNASWEVTLLFDKDEKGQMRISPDSTIKNVHVSHREQTLGNPAVPIAGVYFRLRQNESGRDFYFTGEKVPWDKERTLGVDGGFLVSSINPKQPVELEQVFDRGNTPIASIDEIRIPYVSDRNANRSLVAAKPERFGKKDAAADATKAAPAGPAPFGMAPGGSAPPAGSVAPAPASTFGQQAGGQGSAGAGTGALPSAAPDRTLNINLDRNRYLFVTDQSRHLPLAMTLTVDQSHLADILVAIANSRLRFQTTQVEFRRQPAGANVASSGTGNGEAPGTIPGPGGSSGRFPAAPRPFGAPGAAAPAMPALILDNPNLVEVTIYGVASLYERPREDKK